MAFRTSKDPASSYAALKEAVANLKINLLSAKEAMLAGRVSGNLIIQMHAELIRVYGLLTEASSVPLITAYVRSIEGSDYNIAGEFTSVRNAIYTPSPVGGLGGWIMENWNTDNYLTFSETGVSTRSYSTSETATLRGKMDVLIATID